MQETDNIFKLHILSIDTFIKIRKMINRVIISKGQSKRYLTKEVLFDILSLIDQLYCSQSTTLDESESKKIFFSKNPALNL